MAMSSMGKNEIYKAVCPKLGADRKHIVPVTDTRFGGEGECTVIF